MYNIPNYNDIEIFVDPWRSVKFKFEDEDQIQMVVDWCNENFDQEWTVRIHKDDYSNKRPNVMSSLFNMDADALRELGTSTKPIHEAVTIASKSLTDTSEESEFDKFDRFYFKDESSMVAFKLRWI